MNGIIVELINEIKSQKDEIHFDTKNMKSVLSVHLQCREVLRSLTQWILLYFLARTNNFTCFAQIINSTLFHLHFFTDMRSDFSMVWISLQVRVIFWGHYDVVYFMFKRAPISHGKLTLMGLSCTGDQKKVRHCWVIDKRVYLLVAYMNISTSYVYLPASLYRLFKQKIAFLLI